MDTNFSLADIAAVMGRDREGTGLFGGGGGDGRCYFV